MAVFDLHVHTTRGSSDSSLTPEELIDRAQSIGLDGVCLTEHGGGWEPHVMRRVFERAGMTVVSGLEVDTDLGHVLVFGLHSYVDGMLKIEELRKQVDKAGGFMVAAHPFRYLFNRPPANINLLFKSNEARPGSAPEAAGHPLFELVDDVEAANGSNTDEENGFALEVARHLGHPGTGGSDAHSVHGIGRCVTLFEGDIRSESDLIQALRASAYSPAQGSHLGRLQPLLPELDT